MQYASGKTLLLDEDDTVGGTMSLRVADELIKFLFNAGDFR